jgi:large subunit ribosomal protein L23
VRVNTMNYEGKPKRVMGRMRNGKKPDWKKAIVTLRDGDKIELI